MKLLLTSSGVTNNSIKSAFLEILEKPFKEARLTFIPTAANVEQGDKTWLVDDKASIVSEGKWKKFN